MVLFPLEQQPFKAKSEETSPRAARADRCLGWAPPSALVLWPGRFWTRAPGQLGPEPPLRGDPVAAPGTMPPPPSPRTRTPGHSPLVQKEEKAMPWRTLWSHRVVRMRPAARPASTCPGHWAWRGHGPRVVSTGLHSEPPAKRQGDAPSGLRDTSEDSEKRPAGCLDHRGRTLLASCPAYLPTGPALTSPASAPQLLAPDAPPTPNPTLRKRVVEGPGGCGPGAWLLLCERWMPEKGHLKALKTHVKVSEQSI